MKNFKIQLVIERSYASTIDRMMQGLKRELSHVASPFLRVSPKKLQYSL